jgi:hypothetical protein
MTEQKGLHSGILSKFVPAVVGPDLFWQHLQDNPDKELCTVSNEVFTLLLLKNSYKCWVDIYNKSRGVPSQWHEVIASNSVILTSKPIIPMVVASSTWVKRNLTKQKDGPTKALNASTHCSIVSKEIERSGQNALRNVSRPKRRLKISKWKQRKKNTCSQSSPLVVGLKI